MRRISQLRSPLDRVFSRPSHLAVLRALKDSREGMSGRAVAREAGVNHQAGAVAIRSLEAMGLVQRLGSGHTQMIHLNFDHHLVAELILPLLRREGDLLSAIRRDIVRTFRDNAVTITIFGSVARGEDAPGSDLDVLIVARGANKNQTPERAADLATQFQKRYGLRLAPIVMNLTEARRMAVKSSALLRNILADGVDLLPEKLRDLLH